eukprot:scaffold208378_cov42-Tisochrysis_lutea.AAC.2
MARQGPLLGSLLHPTITLIRRHSSVWHPLGRRHTTRKHRVSECERRLTCDHWLFRFRGNPSLRPAQTLTDTHLRSSEEVLGSPLSLAAPVTRSRPMGRSRTDVFLQRSAQLRLIWLVVTACLQTQRQEIASTRGTWRTCVFALAQMAKSKTV